MIVLHRTTRGVCEVTAIQWTRPTMIMGVSWTVWCHPYRAGRMTRTDDCSQVTKKMVKKCPSTPPIDAKLTAIRAWALVVWTRTVWWSTRMITSSVNHNVHMLIVQRLQLLFPHHHHHSTAMLWAVWAWALWSDWWCALAWCSRQWSRSRTRESWRSTRRPVNVKAMIHSMIDWYRSKSMRLMAKKRTRAMTMNDPGSWKHAPSTGNKLNYSSFSPFCFMFSFSVECFRKNLIVFQTCFTFSLFLLHLRTNTKTPFETIFLEWSGPFIPVLVCFSVSNNEKNSIKRFHFNLVLVLSYWFTRTIWSFNWIQTIKAFHFEYRLSNRMVSIARFDISNGLSIFIALIVVVVLFAIVMILVVNLLDHHMGNTLLDDNMLLRLGFRLEQHLFK